MKIKCPTCGSTAVIAETEAIVRFKINDNDNIEVVSEWNDIIKHINNEVIYNCECENCGEFFEYDMAAKYRGGNDND